MPTLNRRCAKLAYTTMIGVLCLAACAANDSTSRQPDFTELSGELPDRTLYLIRMPSRWNGTVISDLDYRTRAEDGIYRELLRRGYALSGTARRPDRLVNLSQRGDIERVQQTLAILKEKFGEPKRVIAYGRSAGGGAAISSAENYARTTDGAIALCATTPFLSANHRFDFLFLLKAALGPDDPSLVVHPLSADRTAQIARWEEVLGAARQTVAGRARIAFAFAAAQFPYFGHTGVQEGTPPPADPADPDQVAAAMMASVVPQVRGTMNNLHQLNTNPAPIVWNDGADYGRYFANADPLLKRMVEDMYREAGLDLQQQLETVARMPRVAMDRAGTAVWVDDPVQTPRGNPKIPIVHMHTDGDQSIAQEQSQVYFDQVRRNGKQHLLRAVTVHRGGHCTFTTAEELAVVEVMMRRLDTGRFVNTSADAMNGLARSFGVGTSNFVERSLRSFNGEWRLRTYSDEFFRLSDTP